MWEITAYIAVSIICGLIAVKKVFPFIFPKKAKKQNNFCEIPPEVCIGNNLSDCESCNLKPECKDYLAKRDGMYKKGL